MSPEKKISTNNEIYSDIDTELDDAIRRHAGEIAIENSSSVSDLINSHLPEDAEDSEIANPDPDTEISILEKKLDEIDQKIQKATTAVELKNLLIEKQDLVNGFITKQSSSIEQNLESIANDTERIINTQNSNDQDRAVLSAAVNAIRNGSPNAARDHINKYASSIQAKEQMSQVLDRYVLEHAVSMIGNGSPNAARDHINKYASRVDISGHMKRTLDI